METDIIKHKNLSIMSYFKFLDSFMPIEKFRFNTNEPYWKYKTCFSLSEIKVTYKKNDNEHNYFIAYGQNLLFAFMKNKRLKEEEIDCLFSILYAIFHNEDFDSANKNGMEIFQAISKFKKDYNERKDKRTLQEIRSDINKLIDTELIKVSQL